MSVSKRLRYEILRRDGHQCRYCGATAPEATLTVDHVVPTALGGGDEPGNLVAACKDCNAGKSASSPDAPLVANVSNDAIRWAAAVRVAAENMANDVSARNTQRTKFKKVWNQWMFDSHDKAAPLPAGWGASVDAFLNAGLPMVVLLDCIEIAMGARNVQLADRFRYLCGVAWKKVGELQNSAKQQVSETSSTADAASSSNPYRDACEHLYGCLSAFDDDKYRAEMAKKFTENHADDEHGDGTPVDYSSWGDDLRALVAAVEDEVDRGWSWSQFVWATLHDFPEEDRTAAAERAREEFERRGIDDYNSEDLVRNALSIAVANLLEGEQWLKDVSHTPMEAPF